MPEQIISPLVPATLRRDSARRPYVDHARSPSPPLVAVPDLPSVLAGVFYGMGRLDSSGRVSDRAITECLGWHPGERVTFTATSTVVTAVRDRDGLITLPARARLVVPAPLRHRCGLRSGDRVLLAACPHQDRLVIYPLAAVHEVLTRHLNTPPTQPGEPAPTPPRLANHDAPVPHRPDSRQTSSDQSSSSSGPVGGGQR